MPAELIIFMRWIGLHERVEPVKRNWSGEWFKDGDCPF